MPYIYQNHRKEAMQEPKTGAELAYHIMQDCVDYLTDTFAYADIAEVRAALEAARDELEVTLFRPYEALKREVNGPVVPRVKSR